jgi:hypothetical protein
MGERPGGSSGLVVTVVDGRRMVVAVADLEKGRAGAFAGVFVSSGLLVLVLLFLGPGLIAAGRLSLAFAAGHGFVGEGTYYLVKKRRSWYSPLNTIYTIFWFRGPEKSLRI